LGSYYILGYKAINKNIFFLCLGEGVVEHFLEYITLIFFTFKFIFIVVLHSNPSGISITRNYHCIKTRDWIFEGAVAYLGFFQVGRDVQFLIDIQLIRQ